MTIELETEINRIAIIMLLAHGFHQLSDRGFAHSDGRQLHLPNGHLPNRVMQHLASEVRKLIESAKDGDEKDTREECGAPFESVGSTYTCSRSVDHAGHHKYWVTP